MEESFIIFVYVKLHAGNFPDECKWAEPIRGIVIPGHDLVIVKNVDPEDCKAACEKEESFHCAAFEYSFLARTCHLSDVNRYDLILGYYSTTDYFERQCDGKWVYGQLHN